MTSMTKRPLRILLVDDEPDFLESIAFWLSSRGYEVAKANSGLDAIELVKRSAPDLVFLDVNMPEIDGIETLRRIRAFNKTVPIIIVTAGYTDENRFAGAHGLGISGLFPKGESLAQLTQVLEVAIRTHGKLKPPSDGGGSSA